MTPLMTPSSKARKGVMTSAQLAKTLNLSRTTVSLVLNSRGEEYLISFETVQRVQQAAQTMNYTVNPVAAVFP